MSLLDFSQIYSPIVATLAFGLSLLLAIYEIRKNKPRVKIKISYGTLMNFNNESSESLFVFDIHNVGHIPVTISSCGWFHPDNTRSQWLIPYNLRLPYEIAPHKITDAYFAKRWLHQYKSVENICGFYVKDEEGNMWKKKFSRRDKKELLSYSNNDYLIVWDKNTRTYMLEKSNKQ